ncbi:hypothetical protein SADUNF_Sadunf16G0156400 [Salix dunnii]|uniref:Translation initiation factor eIF2B subunit gamma n=1 Tax=Salix dunnii TaxID=1413687 RepID=A0A835MGM5_9ROSI|nr:hypothetical protein SADUNF_Sadunf16G0156400 [Salix dunnii]
MPESCNSRHFSWLMKSCFPNPQDPTTKPLSPNPIITISIPTTTTLSSLSDDLLLECLSRVPSSCLPSVSRVCPRWSRLLHSPSFLYLRRLHHLIHPTIFTLSAPFAASLQLPDGNDANTNDPLWKVASCLPFPVSSLDSLSHARLSAIGSRIYIIGRNEMFCYDVWSGIITSRSSMIYPRKKFATAVLSGKIYVAGGGSRAGAALEEYDPETDTWSVVAHAIRRRFGCIGAAVDGVFYVIGGLKIGAALENEVTRAAAAGAEAYVYASTMDLFDVESRAWLRSRAVPGGGCAVAACAVAGYVYILTSHALELSFCRFDARRRGGGGGSSGKGFGEWCKIKSPPLPAQVRLDSTVRFSCVGVENKVVLIQVSGCIDDLLRRSGRSVRGLKEGLVLVYDCISGEWSRGPHLPEEVPKALLPVANRPVLSYVLEQLELSNLKDLIVVVEGEDAAIHVGGWISNAYVDRLHVEVAAVHEEVGTAGALRAIAHHLTANDILVVSGDLVFDVPPGALAAAHRKHNAVVTTMLCPAPVSGPTESASSGGKDKIKKPRRYNIIGLDPSKQFLLHIATGAEVEKDIRIQKSILRAVGQMEIRADLMDAHMYAFKRSVLQEVLDEKDEFQSLKEDVLPYLVRSQLKSEVVLFNGVPQTEENGNEKVSSQNNQAVVSRIMANASTPSFHELSSGNNGSTHVRRIHKCCAYIASESRYCQRLNSIQAFSDINRDVIGDASHLSGYSFSAHNNIIHPSSQLGSRTTVGPHCMLWEGSQMGDKCSVKRSVIGRHCRIGSNVKVVNSVVMNHVTIGDGCSIQGSVICSNAQLQERAVLKDCQVGAGFVVTAGSEHKGESLARK